MDSSNPADSVFCLRSRCARILARAPVPRRGVEYVGANLFTHGSPWFALMTHEVQSFIFHGDKGLLEGDPRTTKLNFLFPVSSFVFYWLVCLSFPVLKRPLAKTQTQQSLLGFKHSLPTPTPPPRSLLGVWVSGLLPSYLAFLPSPALDTVTGSYHPLACWLCL